MEPEIKVAVIIGSTRQKRFSEKPAQYIFDELQKIGGVHAELIDLRDWPLPFFNDPITPSQAKGTYENPAVQQWADNIKTIDGFIIITPEYNHGYPAVLKNALDTIFVEWHGKPVGFVGYGNAGGARAIEQLRQVVIELFMHPIRNAIHIPSDMYMTIMNEQVPVPVEHFKPLREGRNGDRLQTFFDELLALTRTLHGARTEHA